MPVPFVSPPPPRDDSEPTTSTAEALSDPGMEKKIPLRFINLKSCTPGPGCPDNADYDDILLAVDRANDVYKAAGIQFWVKSVERYRTPNLANMSSVACFGNRDLLFRWDVVRNELQAMFPMLPYMAWNAHHEKVGAWWLASVNTVYGMQDELVVWLPEALNRGASCTGANISQSPFSARSIEMGGVGDDFKLAHELGHAFGLAHPWEAQWANAERIDPATGAPSVASDYWDLVYYRGASGNVYFNSKLEAQAHEANLELIDKGDGKCTDSSGVVTCIIKRTGTCWHDAMCGTGEVCVLPAFGIGTCAEVRSTGDAAMKGLGFIFSGWIPGPNIMSYHDHFRPNALSDSQVMRIRKHLRWSVQLDSVGTAQIGKGTVSTRLPLLGNWNLREPAQKLDFDGDGWRDVGIWTPPTSMGTNGTFTVLLSSNGFSKVAGEYMNVQLGQLGDVPVVADYDGDGQTDLAVYQPGGGQNRNDPTDEQGYWRWCATSNIAENTTCPTLILTAFGNREDVPLPGLLFSGATPHVAIYRPDEGKWEWRPVSGGTPTTKYLGNRFSVPLPGHYDGDFLTDIAVYETTTGTFRLRRSQQSWNVETARAFGSIYVPADSGSPADRAAAMPLAGVYRPQTICNPGCATYPRSAFCLWDPSDGTWTTMWDPVNSSAKHSCTWGSGPIDMPITGIDRNDDGYTDMLVYRGKTFDGPGYFWFKNATPSTCTGSEQTIDHQSTNRVRQRVFGVADMTGDGQGEIMVVQPDTMTIQWLTSDDGYQTVITRTIGNERSIVL